MRTLGSPREPGTTNVRSSPFVMSLVGVEKAARSAEEQGEKRALTRAVEGQDAVMTLGSRQFRWRARPALARMQAVFLPRLAVILGSLVALSLVTSPADAGGPAPTKTRAVRPPVLNAEAVLLLDPAGKTL